MRYADVERFLFIPYDENEFDCADLVVWVERELFGRSINAPGFRPRGAKGQRVIGEVALTYAEPTDAPVDGDLVLMHDRGGSQPGHAGIYLFLAHEPWVLHANESTGCSVLHRVRELGDYGARIEGYYRWK